jgi:hypothetical protein
VLFSCGMCNSSTACTAQHSSPVHPRCLLTHPGSCQRHASSTAIKSWAALVLMGRLVVSLIRLGWRRNDTKCFY